ncbi:N-acyl homoserine lactonase family protein [Bradyrhizobium sp. 157]|uniref:N-acyl homoserine lactonase family protein n=1 Tax=Bradyrhizobium sp. 157 TaxID=2782631 RepID=UPI001FFC28B5|nr:N-acyl homoserine lactonase family protein [Bradyrhizobium sp. 157]MCK1641374.1 N-acyl homoserine lactonase family protein [Bradyrhizobium sp. 157]
MIPRELSRLLAAFSTALRPRCGVAIAALIALIAVSGAGKVMAAPPDVEMWRLDCGEFKSYDLERLSDVFAYPGKKKALPNSCYLIRHEKQFMLWDAGFSASAISSMGKSRGLEMNQAISSQLQTINVKLEQISIVGLSHWHFDHTGQAANFPNARLLMGKADYEYLAGKQSNYEDIAPWLGSSTNVEKLVGDKDIFGDGSVIMLATPGHTAGHYVLLVRLPTFGAVVLSGDLWHSSEQLNHNGMPRGQDRADTLASMDRIQKVVSNLKATLVIQHEAADIGKLPVFPASAH